MRHFAQFVDDVAHGFLVGQLVQQRLRELTSRFLQRLRAVKSQQFGQPARRERRSQHLFAATVQRQELQQPKTYNNYLFTILKTKNKKCLTDEMSM